MVRFLAALVFCHAMPASMAAEIVRIPQDGARRTEVLFLGSENRFNHDPLARFRVLRKALGPKGVNLTYSATLDVLTSADLPRYDVLLLFANHETIAKDQQDALLRFVREGGGFVGLHCAAGCFRGSHFDGYVEMLGAQFASHGTGVFRATIVNRTHPVMKGFEGFECWDETYVHRRHGEGRTILQKRGDEPWTWIKNYGNGRVFYTASGHDHRCWDLPQYHDLVDRAIRWTAAGPSPPATPDLRYRKAAVPKDPDNPVGPLNEIQQPLAPAESLTLAQIPVGFELQLFASEPDIVNPICLAWDHRGRLWTVEAFDYPHKIATDAPRDRIKILEDTDRDGVADKITVFAEGLNICTSVLPTLDGAIATNGRNMVHLSDTDGDGRADKKRVIFSGIQLRDTHACVSNLRHGFDGWIYATVGYSGLKVRLNGKTYASSQGVFRFKADGSDFEILQNTSNNTWGISFTEEGDLVGSTANGNPSWYLSIPNRYFELVGLKPERTPRADGNDLAHPITADYFQNNPKERFSSAAGHAVYTARRFPDDWWNQRVLICEPPLHLVAAPRMANHGTTFKTTQFEQNLYASADAWSAPVAAEVGPDGAVWIADWYNPICNHNPYRPHQKRGPGNAFMTDDRDRKHGRIYRVYPKGSEDDPYPDLEDAKECAATLIHSNLFWRLCAQRYILKTGNLTGFVGPNSRIDIHLSEILCQLRSEATYVLSLSKDRAVAGTYCRGQESAKVTDDHSLSVLGATDHHPLARMAAALHLATLSPSPSTGAALATIDRVEGHLETAVRIAILRHPEGYVRHWLESPPGRADAFAVSVMGQIAERLAKNKKYLSPGLVSLARSLKTPLAGQISAAARKTASSKPSELLSESAQRGRDTYFACIACHQPDGRGLAGTFPPLDGSKRVTGDPERLVKIVLDGLQGPLKTNGGTINGVMPGHRSALDDQQIADVLGYIRSAWSNDAGDIDVDTARQVRETTKNRKVPWTTKELRIDADHP